jgi:hypothetical protein
MRGGGGRLEDGDGIGMMDSLVLVRYPFGVFWFRKGIIEGKCARQA